MSAIAANPADTAGTAGTVILCDGTAGTAVSALVLPTDIAGTASPVICLDGAAGTAVSALDDLRDRVNNLSEKMANLEALLSEPRIPNPALQVAEVQLVDEHLAGVGFTPEHTARCLRFSISDVDEMLLHQCPLEDLDISYDFFELQEAPAMLSETLSYDVEIECGSSRPGKVQQASDCNTDDLRSLVERILAPMLSPFMENIVGMMGQATQERFNMIKEMVGQNSEKLQHQLDKQNVQIASLAGSLAALRSRHPITSTSPVRSRSKGLRKSARQ